jgi:membrane protein required for colicin V production
MNWVDYAIIAVLGLSVLMGLWRGFIGEVLALAVWACAFWVAWLFGPPLADHFSAAYRHPRCGSCSRTCCASSRC